MEWIRKDNPSVFLDGGHNLQGAVALKDTLDQLQKGKKIVFLCGVMRDKEYKKMLETLLSSDQYRVQAVLCTRPENPRALPALFLAKTVSEVLDNSPQSSYNKLATVIFDDKVSVMTDRAFQLAAETKATLVAFGSLYMAGEIRRRIRHDLV
jgi:dihydrofolate synthase/folylpolyglutamate synthase